MMAFLWLLSNLPFLTLAMLQEYVVYPVERRDQAACAHTNRIISSMVEVVEVTSFHSVLRGVTEFWLVKADSSDRPTIRSIAGVRDREAFLRISFH